MDCQEGQGKAGSLQQYMKSQFTSDQRLAMTKCLWLSLLVVLLLLFGSKSEEK